MKEQMLVQA